MIAYIGISVLLIIFGLIFYIFTKPYNPNEKTIFVNKVHGSSKISGMSSQKSKKRKKS